MISTRPYRRVSHLIGAFTENLHELLMSFWGKMSELTCVLFQIVENVNF